MTHAQDKLYYMTDTRKSLQQYKKRCENEKKNSTFVQFKILIYNQPRAYCSVYIIILCIQIKLI